MLYYQRWSFSNLELHAGYDWQVKAQNLYHSLFLMCHLSIPTRITQKLHSTYGSSVYQTTVLLSERFLLWFRVAIKIWLESYSPRHASWSFSDATLCVYCKHKQKNIGVPATLLHSNRLRWWPRMILFVLEVAKQSQPASYGPVHTLLYRYLVCNLHMTTITFTTVLHTNNTLFYNNKVGYATSQLMSCCSP